MIKELVVSGGTMKGVFAAGVLYELGKKDIHFERNYGLSIGAGNLAIYVTKQPKLLKNFWLEEMSDGKVIKKNKYDIDDFIKHNLEKHKLDQHSNLIKNNFFTVVTNCKSGKNTIIDMYNNNDYYKLLKAAASIKYFTKQVKIGKKYYYDSCCSVFHSKNIIKNDFLLIRSSSKTADSFIGKMINLIFGTKKQNIQTPYIIEPDIEHVGYMTDEKVLLEQQFHHGQVKAKEFIKKYKKLLH